MSIPNFDISLQRYAFILMGNIVPFMEQWQKKVKEHQLCGLAAYLFVPMVLRP